MEFHNADGLSLMTRGTLAGILGSITGILDWLGPVCRLPGAVVGWLVFVVSGLAGVGDVFLLHI